jgi:hypothetical protein
MTQKPPPPQKHLLMGCGAHNLRVSSKAASKQVFVSPDLGNAGLAAFRAANDERKPVKSKT